jgi:phage tail sheath protein FI
MARPRRTRDPVESAPTSTAAIVGALPGGRLPEPLLVTSLAGLEQEVGSAEGETADALRLFFENGGLRAFVTGFDELRPHRSLELLAGVRFQLLAVPATARPTGTSAAGLAVAAALEARRRRAFYVADPPAERSAGDVARWARSFGGGRGSAVYFPRLVVRDGGGEREVAASGAVLGVYARADRERGVWTAPTGTQGTVRGVLGPAVDLADSAHAVLVEAGVNTIRRLPAGPVRLWSARTREEHDPEWKYVNVRRFALFLEESIEQATRWAVFEPNGAALWRQVRSAVEAFLAQLFRAGALRGSKPQEAFFVRCDRTTMTEDDIDSGRVVVLVGFAPLRPAEFVVLRIGLWARRDEDDDPAKPS